MRLRREADRAPLPRTGAPGGQRPAGVLRGGRPAVQEHPGRGRRRQVRPATERRAPRHEGPPGSADDPHPADAEHPGASGKHRGRPRDDDPLRGRPPVADLPAADDGAVRDRADGRAPRTTPGGVRLLQRPRGDRRHVRGQAHGVEGGGRPGEERGRRPAAFRGHERPRGRDLHPDGETVLQRRGVRGRGPGPHPGGRIEGRPLDRARDLLDLPRLRTHAVVGERRRAGEGPVRAGRGGREDRPRGGSEGPRGRRGAQRRRRRTA